MSLRLDRYVDVTLANDLWPQESNTSDDDLWIPPGLWAEALWLRHKITGFSWKESLCFSTNKPSWFSTRFKLVILMFGVGDALNYVMQVICISMIHSQQHGARQKKSIYRRSEEWLTKKGFKVKLQQLCASIRTVQLSPLSDSKLYSTLCSCYLSKKLHVCRLNYTYLCMDWKLPHLWLTSL